MTVRDDRKADLAEVRRLHRHLWNAKHSGDEQTVQECRRLIAERQTTMLDDALAKPSVTLWLMNGLDIDFRGGRPTPSKSAEWEEVFEKKRDLAEAALAKLEERRGEPLTPTRSRIWNDLSELRVR